MVDWGNLPVRAIPVDRCVYPCHDLDPAHHHPVVGALVRQGPIHVQELVDGSFFVHDGRHRLIRATHLGETTIPARVYPV